MRRRFLILAILIVAIGVVLFLRVSPVLCESKGVHRPSGGVLSTTPSTEARESVVVEKNHSESVPTNQQIRTLAKSPADRSHRVSDKARALLTAPLDATTFRTALAILKYPDETLESQILALQWLSATARKLRPDERRLLHKVTSALAADAPEAVPLRAKAMRSAVAMSALMRDENEMSQLSISAENEFMVRMSEDKLLDPLIRAAAIKGIEVLRITEGITLLEKTLADPEEQRTPDVTRRACLALTRLSSEKALPLVSRVIRETEDASVFGTAAYSLGQIKSPRAVATLVQNADRFPDTGACDFALVDMEKTILTMLKKPDHENEEVIAAIRATRYLWRDGQSKEFTPLLKELVDNPALEVKKAAVKRLMEEAAEKPFAEEKALLRDVLTRAKKHRGLSKLSASMEKRLTAKRLESRISTTPIVLPEPKED